VKSLGGSPAESVTVTANRVRCCNGKGISCEAVSRLKVLGNDVGQSGQHGLYVRESPDAIVANNLVSGSGLKTSQQASQKWDDISLSHGSHKANLTGNICRKDPDAEILARAAIWLDSGGGDEVIVTGNDLRGSSGLVVNGDGVSGTIITGNNLRGSTEGLAVHNAIEAVITGNDLRDSPEVLTAKGITVSGVSGTPSKIAINENNLRGNSGGLTVSGDDKTEVVVIGNDLRESLLGLIVKGDPDPMIVPQVIQNLDSSGSSDNWNLI
jgi:nitrous oxidase accessory protein NosD